MLVAAMTIAMGTMPVYADEWFSTYFVTGANKQNAGIMVKKAGSKTAGFYVTSDKLDVGSNQFTVYRSDTTTIISNSMTISNTDFNIHTLTDTPYGVTYEGNVSLYIYPVSWLNAFGIAGYWNANAS